MPVQVDQCNCTGVLDPMQPCFQMQHSLSIAPGCHRHQTASPPQPHAPGSAAAQHPTSLLPCLTACWHVPLEQLHILAARTPVVQICACVHLNEVGTCSIAIRWGRAPSGHRCARHAPRTPSTPSHLQGLGFGVSGREAGYTLCPQIIQHMRRQQMEVQQQVATCECPVRHVAPA